MSSSKTKRTITVEKSSSDSNAKSKPSVFERLGAPHTFSSSEICLDFAKNGTCTYGSKCKYSHVTPRRDRDRDRDDLRNRVSRKRDGNESDSEAKKSISQRKDKDSKIKSAVVVTKSTENIDDIWPEPSGDVDKGSIDRKHESKSRQQGSSSSHGTEGDGHKASKQDVRLDDRKDEGATLQSSSSKTKNKSPSRGDDDSSRRKSRDNKKKKKRNKSQGSHSPDRVDDKQDQKHQKDPMMSSKSSSDKHKSAGDARKAESSTSVAASVSLDRSSEKKSKAKDEKNKSVENRLLMIAMESDKKPDATTTRVGRAGSSSKSKREFSPSLPPPPLPTQKGKDARKEYTSPSARVKDPWKDRVESPTKSKKVTKDRSISPTRSKDVVQDRSVSPSRSKDRAAKTSRSKSQIQPLMVPVRVSEKLKLQVEEKPLDQPDKREVGSQKLEKGKASRKRRRSSTSSASSSSSSSSGSESGSSSGSSTSGSSSSSSGSSDESSDDRKPTKERRGKDAKTGAGRQPDAKLVRQNSVKGLTKGGSRGKKDKERTPQDEPPHARRPGIEKDKTRTSESTKHGHGKKDLSPGRGRKKDWDKGLRHMQDSGLDSRGAKVPIEPDKASRDSQDRAGTGDPSRQKSGDVGDYPRKARSPAVKDDRGKPTSDVSRRGQSPAESQRSHLSAKPIPDPERDLEGQSLSGQYPDYYSGREKTGRKEGDRYQQYDEPYAKKHSDPRSQGYASSSHKHHSADPYDRSREPADLDRDERDSRYSRDHGYEADRYPLSTERHHPEVGDESRTRQDYYSSGYRDDKRSGRVDEFSRKETERVDKHSSSYETRESDRDYDARDREKSRDQRTTGEYREKPRTESIEHSGSKYKKVPDGPVGQEVPLDESRRERPSRRGQWEAEREADDQARQMIGRSDPSRGYADKREVSRKRPLEEEGGSGRSPGAKKMRDGSPSESHHSFSSRTAYDRDADRLEKERDRSQRSRNVGRDDDRHSNRGEGTEYRDKSRSDRDRATEKDWESSRRHDSKDRSKDSKVIAEGRERGSDIKESWHGRDDSHKRRRSLEKTGSEREGWERGKDWKRSRIDPEVDQKALQLAEREKPILERGSRRDEDHRGSPSRDRSPKSSSYAYKQEKTDGDKRSSDPLAFAKSMEADVESRGGRVKSEEKRDLVVKDAEPSMIPVHVDDRMRRSQSRGSLSSKHSQRDRDTRRDDRHYEDRFDLYSRDGHYRDERLTVPERTYDHDDREPWTRDRSYDRGRPEEETARPFRGPAFDHDRGERDPTKGRDFPENDWDVDPFRRDNLGFRGIPRPPNWERDRPRDDWDNRYDRGGLEPDYRARREALLPPPPRPRPAPEVRVPSPLPPPVEPVVVPPPVEHIPVRHECQRNPAEVKPEHVTPTKSGRGSKDEDTGYDDISDGELDDLIGVVEEDKEEHQVKKTGVVDILDIKWESLMQNSHEKPAVSSSILSRFQAAAIFRRIGVSRSFAGDDLLIQVKTICQEHIEDEEPRDVKEERKETEEHHPAELKTEEPERAVVKEELEDATTGKSSSSPAKNSEEAQPSPLKVVAPVTFELLDDVADFHAGLQLKSSERVGIVTNVGPYRRALCARRDLAIRRGLCKVEKEDILMFPTHVVDQDLYKQSLQLFHHDRTVEKRLPLGVCVPQRLHPMSAA